MDESNSVILVTGANGQIGTSLSKRLKENYKRGYIITSDIRKPDKHLKMANGESILLDVLDATALERTIEEYNVDQVYHLAAILSAKGENAPRKAWNINMNGLFNVLEAARKFKLKVFFPSSIGVFSRQTPSQNTPQRTILEPETVYGISKVAGESWCQYYHNRYGVDVRSVRYPGIIGYESKAGGGTTDYAVDIFHQALKSQKYECFLDKKSRLPMMYMPDAIRATINIMEAPVEELSVRTSYNISGMSFTPAELFDAIKKFIPNFEISYKPDFRQQIADSWPESIDDSYAQNDWGWSPEFDMEGMTEDMLDHLWDKYKQTGMTI